MTPIQARYSSKAADLDRFINEQNINRYRKLLDPGIDEARPSTILQLLECEFATLFAKKSSYERRRRQMRVGS
jgi:hypothetical protein